MVPVSVSGPTLQPDGQIAIATVWLDGPRIRAITPGYDPTADLTTAGVIAPGLIDLQVNGGWGADVATDGRSVAVIAARLVAHGVTAFLPTIITSPWAGYPQRLAEIASVEPLPGAAAWLGVHLEGPYLSPARAGAHDPRLLRPIELPEVERWADHPLVRLVTLAPELPGALPVVGRLAARQIVVSAGHSAATYDQAMSAFGAGVRWGTHLFNAMNGLHQREPGLAGALLSHATPAGLIADGRHVHPAMLRLAVRLKGAAGLTLVSDAMAALGMPDGRFQLAGRDVLVAAGVAHLADGTLAGSTTPLDEAIRLLVDQSICTVAEALTMASRTPARLLGLADRGHLLPGARADLIVLDPSLRVRQTIIGGQVVYDG